MKLNLRMNIYLNFMMNEARMIPYIKIAFLQSACDIARNFHTDSVPTERPLNELIIFYYTDNIPTECIDNKLKK